MKNSTMLRIVIFAAALTLSLGAAACDTSNKKLTAGNNTNTETAKPDTGSGDEADTGGVSDEEGEGHGKEPGEYELLEPGFMNGSWRVAEPTQDAPVAYFDTFQDEGDSEVTGDFVMGNALYEGGIDGQSGEIAVGSFDGTTLTLKWNPTTDPDEMFTLVATKTTEDHLQGKITADRNVELDYAVSVTRQMDDE
ncbi:hypothetical protein [Bradymonas sediminis]|uniref:Uncharacterized protein n=1 Tax=Bradymonas sediminis TaxID=1548548 RepID=A0A2Z4FJK4_9DELT|nr:hypothetical protein [Bradymonas sediminis]AWV88886.1 hypothetical protein DN745_05850 [Bradymonas sediminis]TDP71891.1 hypothetical protein DFR33_108105 [Bradymonas sediminis]